MHGLLKRQVFESAKRYAPLPRQRSLARKDDRIWYFMGRTDSTLWFKGNGVKLKAVLHTSPSLRKWCRDRSGGSSTTDEAKGKMVLDIMKMVLVVDLDSLPPVFVGGRGEGLETGGVFDGPGDRCNTISIGWT